MRISVVIPTLGREKLARTLDRLERQTVSPDAFEVVIVTDHTVEDYGAVAAVAAAHRRPMAVTQLEAERPGASAARNVGWRAARAPLVLFMGDDILAVPRFLEEHLDWHARHGGPDAGVLGLVRWASEIRVSPFMRWLDHGVQFDYPAIEGERASWFNFYTANISLPRALLEEVDGFDEQRFPFLYEDIDLGYRLHERGFTLHYNRAAVGEHLHPTTVDDWRRRMAAVATAERDWVAHRPEMPAYFHDRITAASARPAASGRGRHLLRWIGPRFPLLGPRAWRSADVYYLQQLAPAFLERWERDAAQAEAPASRRVRR